MSDKLTGARSPSQDKNSDPNAFSARERKDPDEMDFDHAGHGDHRGLTVNPILNFDPILTVTWSDIRDVLKPARGDAPQSWYTVRCHIGRPVCQAHLLEFLDDLIGELQDAETHALYEQIEELRRDLAYQAKAHHEELRRLREEHQLDLEAEARDHEEAVEVLEDEMVPLRELAERHRRLRAVTTYDPTTRANNPTAWARVLGDVL